MSDYFDAALKVLFPEEGPYSNDPQDPGGETKWGIARNMHREITDDQWARWTQADSIALYRSKYWDAHRCGELPWDWALALFDGEVNQGGTVVLAQEALGIKIDGIVGPQFIEAAEESQPFHVQKYLALRAKRYTQAPLWAQDGQGWLIRLFNVAQRGVVTPG